MNPALACEPQQFNPCQWPFQGVLAAFAAALRRCKFLRSASARRSSRLVPGFGLPDVSQEVSFLLMDTDVTMLHLLVKADLARAAAWGIRRDPWLWPQ